MYLRVLRTTKQLFFQIFGVLAILWCLVCSKQAILLNFDQKKPTLNTTGTIKWLKHQLSKKKLLSFVLSTLRYICIKNQPNWTIFLGLNTFSVGNYEQKIKPSSLKTATILSKNHHFLTNFDKKFGIDKNDHNTYCVQILGHFDHFKAFYTHFKPYFSHFPLI